ncbi:tRNA (adenine(22)-N(1))-methyltransferase TrmK [Peribacillus cavernae]|uniref:tRNA (Adenine(22)-N(1))-methyltransferase TrmK n=1 Tax=Peribacillus cavernae TaxID=1674310 RepID=A0A433HJQ2_9BACI|nr:tRNA (adenine(22)-N(1))-methyltransferase TrmK [Peribacillus cavernae]MDQ0218280.1 tRNA (adenine22-N1)-methyltransferase [Peribacillus cavernae]RUQ28435.1 tRNA (adenine(22)-N(1))-methyltransferase TrmK [Peribacillus cavernae]
MNHEKLSRRLERVAIHIPKESTLADIGSDHAYLPCYAVLKGLIAKAIAGEVAEGPFRSAREQVEQMELQHAIDVRKGDGLEVLSPNEATCIAVAGMGGTLISSILERGKDRLAGVKRLILQPNVGASNIRIWLLENDWELIDEEILEEDEQIYEILIAEKGDPLRPYSENRDLEIILGPFLKKEQNKAFAKKWSQEKAHWERIVKQLEEKGQNPDLNAKRSELLMQIRMVEEALNQ